MNAANACTGVQYKSQTAAQYRRAKKFSNASKLEPLNSDFPIHRNLPVSHCLDHVTLWHDINTDHVFVMTGPYGNPAAHEAELSTAGIPWFRVPKAFEIYGNGTTTYLLTYPLHAEHLRAIEQKLK